ncbi:MAG: Cdc6/Cdc18 family protein [Candidatus Hodarchaeales archaeon]
MTNNNNLELDELFDQYLENPPIIKKHRVLSHSFLPDSYPHRNQQMKEIASILATALRGARPSNIFIYGKPGTGKTCVTRFVLQRLEHRVQSQSEKINGVRFFYCYVNCKEYSTNYSIYQSVTQEIDASQNIPTTGLPTSEVYQRLIQSLNQLESDNTVFILVLDEIDALIKKSGSEVLYNLTRINISLIQTQVSIIGISNDTKFKDYLDPRVYSSLSEEELVFTPYMATELIDILHERSNEGLHPDTVGEGVIQKIAAIAAREHGDARRALDLFRVAAELTERQGLRHITLSIVDSAKNHIEKNTVQEVIGSLPLQSKLVIAAIYILEETKADDITSGLIYENYSEICQKLSIERVSSRRVSDYLNELDVLGILDAIVVSKGRYGRTKHVRFCVPRILVHEVLSKDSYLNQLV